MENKLLLALMSVFAGPIFADCPDGCVICNNKKDVKLNFGQVHQGWFSCTPVQSQKEAAQMYCDTYGGGVFRGDEGTLQDDLWDRKNI